MGKAKRGTLEIHKLVILYTLRAWSAGECLKTGRLLEHSSAGEFVDLSQFLSRSFPLLNDEKGIDLAASWLTVASLNRESRNIINLHVPWTTLTRY